MNETSPVPRMRANSYAGQCEDELWASSQPAGQRKPGAGEQLPGPAEKEQVEER